MGTPDFLVIGAAKAGTTALDSYLDQHPSIRMCALKETNFFAFDGRSPDCRGPGDERFNREAITDVHTYRDLLAPTDGGTLIGESAPLYLYSPDAPACIAKYCPNVKLIALLRDPVKRAYSSYLHMLRDAREPLLDFGQALEAESNGHRDTWEFLWHYRRVGYYGEQLARYAKFFPPEQMLVLLYEDFQNQSHKVIQQMLAFLEVDEDFVPDMTIRPNMTGVPRSRLLNELLTRPNVLRNVLKPLLPSPLRRLATQVKAGNLRKPPMAQDQIEFLVSSYREDRGLLQEILRRDLSGWVSG